MSEFHPVTPPTVLLLSDHLDAALAAGEDLLSLTVALLPAEAEPDTEAMKAAHAELRGFVTRARELELMLATRLMGARQRADEISRRDTRLRPFARIFVSGTQALADAIDGLAASESHSFDTGDQAIAYLRSRDMIAADAPGLTVQRELRVEETFLVAGVVGLGTLLDLVASFLDAVELHYEIYGPDATEGAAVERDTGSAEPSAEGRSRSLIERLKQAS
ncbi:MAG: hypothetical protein KDJ41_18200 [Hyphomicrobiaceae bacterium]|nr:hypothetical protein [Hyphomicrobiaceae bacterium]